MPPNTEGQTASTKIVRFDLTVPDAFTIVAQECNVQHFQGFAVAAVYQYNNDLIVFLQKPVT